LFAGRLWPKWKALRARHSGVPSRPLPPLPQRRKHPEMHVPAAGAEARHVLSHVEMCAVLLGRERGRRRRRRRRRDEPSLTTFGRVPHLFLEPHDFLSMLTVINSVKAASEFFRLPAAKPKPSTSTRNQCDTVQPHVSCHSNFVRDVMTKMTSILMTTILYIQTLNISVGMLVYFMIILFISSPNPFRPLHPEYLSPILLLNQCQHVAQYHCVPSQYHCVPSQCHCVPSQHHCVSSHHHSVILLAMLIISPKHKRIFQKTVAFSCSSISCFPRHPFPPFLSLIFQLRKVCCDLMVSCPETINPKTKNHEKP